MAYSYGILISLTQDDDVINVDYSFSRVELSRIQRDTSTFTLISELQNPCMLIDHIMLLNTLYTILLL